MVPEPRLEAFIRLVEAAEDRYPYVSAERLRRLARTETRWDSLRGELAGLTRRALADGLLLTEARTRVTRSGAFVPIRLFRLNRRNAFVALALSPC